MEAGHIGIHADTARSVSQPIGNAYWQPIVQACTDATSALSEVLSDFWGVPLKLVFFGASQKTHYYWRMDDFHVSQLVLGSTDSAESPPMALLKLSESTCSALLSRALGCRPASQPAFSFRQLSPLEATILNELSRDLLACLRKNLIRKPKKQGPTQDVHLLWTLALDETQEDWQRLMSPKELARFLALLEVGKIVLSLPANALNTIALPAQAENSGTVVPDSFFYHVEAPARLYVGSSRVPLADLDTLEPGDVIVLEQSTTSQLSLLEPDSGEKMPFPVEIANPDPITMPYTQELAMTDTQPHSARQKLWDNLMIEVGAEFEPVKLPLKQLKQMSEGLVIEMGDLVHNRVCLQVEGKTLAWGELLIVGDKFGVRIKQVVPEPSENGGAMVPAAQSGMPAATSAPEAQVNGVAEDGNLDNFLNNDFDETFEDEEEDW